LVFGLWLSTILLAAPASARCAAGQTQDAAIHTLTYEVKEQALVVTLVTSVPVPRHSLSLPTSGMSEAVLSMPEAVTGLDSKYRPDSPLVTEIRVVQGRGGAGVEIHFDLGKAVLSGLDQAGDRLVFRFEPLGGKLDAAGLRQTAEYRVGVGDKLEVSVFGHDDLSKVVEVRSDGTINYPLIGDLQVAGNSVAQIDEELTRILGKDFLVDPQVSVDVREYQSQWVTIIGEVRNPGQYVLKRNMRLIDLLAAAGGATKEAGSEILITRRTEADGPPRQMQADRDRLLSRDNAEANVPLAHGDIVTIGEKEVFYIRGEVAKPGMYYLEKGLTVMKAISVAGGLGQFANRKGIGLLRGEGDAKREKLTVNLKAIEDGKKADIPLLPNDTIIVPRRIF
jgi:polysaccharide export outer membrane protein